MSIRLAAAAAIDAETAAIDAARKQNWAANALAGEQTVQKLTGLHGKAVRARSDGYDPNLLGSGTVVAITDEDGTIHLTVHTSVLPSKSNWGSEPSVREAHLTLTDEKGGFIHHPEEPARFYSASPKITSLASLGRALADYDEWYEREYEAAWERRRLAE